ncbi:MAG: hypothetical protein K0U98_24990 [Deltaproteobacteria bacterium]|nr:hypothetical protein [Deltaproteobacteria bacterium]
MIRSPRSAFFVRGHSARNHYVRAPLALAILAFACLSSTSLDAHEKGEENKPEAAQSGLYVHVEGMQSDVCEVYLEDTVLSKVASVADIRADHESGWIWIDVEESEEIEEKIRKVVEAECSFKVTDVRRQAPPSAPGETVQDSPGEKHAVP